MLKKLLTHNLWPFLLSAMFIGPINCYAYELPDLGRPSAQALPSKDDQKLGREFMQEIRRSVTIIDDAIINDYIQKLGQRLVKNSLAPNKKFYFFIVQDPEINAFAGPDAHIGVNSGLILATTNENELAAVLSHEIAHVTQHHIERSFEQIHDLNIPMTAAMIAALVLGTQAGDQATANAASGAAMSVMAGSTQHMINFTRANEAEADRVGMETLQRAGFNPEAMPSFFTRLQHLELDYGDQIPTFLKTHPVTSDRIADAENRATQYPSHGYSQDTPSANYYLLARARLQVATSQHLPKIANYFKAPTESRSDINNNAATNKNKSNYTQEAQQYGYTLALIKEHQLVAANNVIDNLIKNNPQESIFYMAKAQIQTINNQIDAAILTLKNAYKLNPNYYPLSLQYATTLIKAHQPQAAQLVLKQQIAPNRQANINAATYTVLAENFAKKRDLANAYFYRAKALESLDSYAAENQARILLQQALQLPNLTTNMKAILQAELDSVKAIIKDQKK